MTGVFSGLAMVLMTEPNKEEFKYDKVKGDNADIAGAEFEMT